LHRRSLSLSWVDTAALRCVRVVHPLVHPLNLQLPQIVPLLSQSSHSLPSSLSADAHAALVKRIQFGGDEVVKAKDGAGSATLSMAYAGAEFTAKVLRAVKGEKGIIAPSYVNLAADPSGGDALKKDIGHDVEYFSSNVELGVGLVHIRFWMVYSFHLFNSPAE
jgi:hypothetical protein